jgi:hypothetical protein
MASDEKYMFNVETRKVGERERERERDQLGRCRAHSSVGPRGTVFRNARYSFLLPFLRSAHFVLSLFYDPTSALSQEVGTA